MIDITYGILNYNPNKDEAATKAYLASIESLYNNRSIGLTDEVYLIDQASQPLLTIREARKYGFQAITLDKNIGISRGINLLANIARGKYVCLVTSDVVFPADLDRILVDDLETHPNVYQICPLSDNSQVEYQKGEIRNEIIPCLASELTIQMWPRTTFEKIGFFEEKFKAAFENIDYALRCFIGGGYNAISCRAKIHHELNMCVKSGARNHTYDGYIKMPDGFNQELLQDIWNKKWPGFQWNVLYDLDFITFDNREMLLRYYANNVFLPYVQEVGY